MIASTSDNLPKPNRRRDAFKNYLRKEVPRIQSLAQAFERLFRSTRDRLSHNGTLDKKSTTPWPNNIAPLSSCDGSPKTFLSLICEQGSPVELPKGTSLEDLRSYLVLALLPDDASLDQEEIDYPETFDITPGPFSEPLSSC